jgi:peptidoglycan/xylan/chitin deacetylase (PgdA/CDA1 family)
MLILAYHRITPQPRGTLSVTTENFRRQLSHLVNNGYENISLLDLCEETATLNAGGRQFAICFDDGYRDNYLHAMPILKEFGMKATVFVSVDYIDTDRSFPWDHAYIESWGGLREEDFCLSWSQLHEMRNSGIFSIGSHTLTHPNLTTIGEQSARHEVVRSKEILEHRLATSIPLFCYPRGDLNQRIVAMVQDAGYRLAVVTPPRPIRASTYTEPRIGIYSHTSMDSFRFKTSQLFQMMVRYGIWPWMTQTRRRLAGGSAKVGAS